MKENTHILVISQYFYPEQFRINDICREWVKRGHRVTVITGIPNYPQGTYFEGYGIFKRRKETFEGINIIRIPLIPRGKHAVMLCLNYLSFVVSGFFWKVFTEIQADYVFIFEVSPMTQALPGVWYANKMGIPCYLYVQDLWPDNVEIITGIHNKYLLTWLNRMVNYIYHNCNTIFATSPSFVDTIINRGVDKNKVKYWPQYAEDFYLPQNIETKNRNQNFLITFTGNVGRAQGLDILPRAAELLSDENIVFRIVGDGRYMSEFMDEIKNRNVESKFQILGRKSPEEIPALLYEGDAAFLSFMNTPIFAKTIPAKLQSYMACGIPIVASAIGETKKIIEDAQCGICCNIGDADELATGIRKLMNIDDLTEMSENAYIYYKRHFDKEQLMNEMEEYFVR